MAVWLCLGPMDVWLTTCMSLHQASEMPDDDGASLTVTIHGLRIMDPGNAMRLSATGRPLRPPMVALERSISAMMLAGMILTIGCLVMTMILCGVSCLYFYDVDMLD